MITKEIRLRTSAWKAIHSLLKGLGYEVVSTQIYGDGSEGIKFRKLKERGGEDD